MKPYLTGLAVALALVSFGCGKSKEGGSGGGGASKSGLAWTPDGYEKLSASCKKALACCEDVATSKGAKSAEDYNGKCSGPALWSAEECDGDLKARVTVMESEGTAVPASCK